MMSQATNGTVHEEKRNHIAIMSGIKIELEPDMGLVCKACYWFANFKKCCIKDVSKVCNIAKNLHGLARHSWDTFNFDSFE